ncbi:MAG: formyl transferase [Syntrophus sp. (in: bacteria)]|nr:formyl transferase [Syntrophus sp. (in: bacteria)]
MKILFIGAVQSSYHALATVLEAKGNVVGCITQPDAGINSDYVDISSICELKGIPLLKTSDVNCADAMDWARNIKPDIVFCIGWSRLLKKDFLMLPPLGVIGFHPAELPKNRGRHPLIWALALGLDRTASTFFFMDEGADSGDILSQEPVEIRETDSARDLYERVVATAQRQIRDFLPKLESNTYTRLTQNHTQANYWRKRYAGDGKIDFRMADHSIYNLVRALTHPYVGAHLAYKDKEVKVWRAEVVDCDLDNIEPGKILSQKNDGIVIKCGIGAVWLDCAEFDSTPAVGEYL